MKQSGFLKLGWRDAARGFLVAFLAFILSYLQEAVIPNLNIGEETKILIFGFLGYISKNFFTKPDEDNKVN